MTITLTPEQAQHLAQLLQQAQHAQARYTETLAVLTLGTVGHGLPLANVDVDTGILTFHALSDGTNAGE